MRRALLQFDGKLAKPRAGARKRFEQHVVGGGKSVGVGGKHFDHADQIIAIENGHDQHGANAQAPGSGGIDARVGFSIEAQLGFAGAKAGAG